MLMFAFYFPLTITKSDSDHFLSHIHLTERTLYQPKDHQGDISNYKLYFLPSKLLKLSGNYLEIQEVQDKIRFYVQNIHINMKNGV